MAINKILFITLSNIGDVLLTLPSLDLVRAAFPHARITVVVGPRPAQIFEGNPAVAKLIVYDKHAPRAQKSALLKELRTDRYDLIVDLRNSIFGWLLPARHKTSKLLRIPRSVVHMKERHLYRTRQALQAIAAIPREAPALWRFGSDDQIACAGALLGKHGITHADAFAVIAPGARSHTKRWSQDKFVALAMRLHDEFGLKVLLVGDSQDVPIAEAIDKRTQGVCSNLAGDTSLGVLAVIVKKARILITNDSAVLHLGSYLGVASVALFGISNESKYGPWGKVSSVVKKQIWCRPCEKSQCRFQTLECMSAIKVDDVLRQVNAVLACRAGIDPAHGLEKTRPPAPEATPAGVHAEGGDLKRLLVIRTDRIGDVLLSTPVIRALRDAHPFAYIAMMVSPYAKEIVDGNPCLDQVIVYDKDGKHKRWYRSLKFALNLRKKKFEAALVLHPTNRVHMVAFLAGIKRRIGYDRKLGFLLSERIPHTKQEGRMHEVEYALDLARRAGIKPGARALYMPIKRESEQWARDFCAQEGIACDDKLVAIHPGASCPSKLWPAERFAEVADILATRYNHKVVIIAGGKDTGLARKVAEAMRTGVVNGAGLTSLSKLASLLKRCSLLISNDSGPVHIAAAVGTPVVAIFGRNQPGLSAVRWGPRGLHDRVIHKDVGCKECAAHNCTKGFLCIKAITVQDVLEAAEACVGARKEKAHEC